MKSYKFEELFDFEKGEFKYWLDDFLPENSSRIGRNRFIDANLNFKELKLPEITEELGEKSLAMNAVGGLLEKFSKKILIILDFSAQMKPIQISWMRFLNQLHVLGNEKLNLGKRIWRKMVA